MYLYNKGFFFTQLEGRLIVLPKGIHICQIFEKKQTILEVFLSKVAQIWDEITSPWPKAPIFPATLLTCPPCVPPHTGAGAPEGNPGQRPPGGEEQLDQQGLHLPANVERSPQHQHSQGRRSSRGRLEPPRWLALRLERQEAVVAPQRESRQCLNADNSRWCCHAQYVFCTTAAMCWFVH